MKIYTIVEKIEDELRLYSYYEKKQAELGMKNLIREYFESDDLNLANYLDCKKEEWKEYGYEINDIIEILMGKNKTWFVDESKSVAWELFEHEIYEAE